MNASEHPSVTDASLPAGRSAHRSYWVVYDGQCPFCRASLRLMMAMDWFRRLRPMDLHATADEVAQRAPELTREQMMEAIQLITPDGRRYSGYFALRRAARMLPLMWPVLPFLYLPGMARLGPRIYRWIALRRYGLIRCTGDGACRL